uniref:SP18.31 n=1 Tax=Bemisia tabaci TaxID=7038 RepID=A0A7S5LIW7_BEMTA|nr:SP18.31 [Bemisia tabaci]
MPVKQCWSKRSSREIIEDAIRKLEDIEKKSLSGIVTPPRVCSEEPEFYEAIDSAHMNTSESNSPRDPSVDVEKGRRPSNSRIPSCISPRGRNDNKERRKASIPPCGKKDPCEKKRERCKAKARKQCRDKKCKTCGKKKERVTERS